MLNIIEAPSPVITNEWKRGYPPGRYYPGMEKDFEVCFTAGGLVWHRRAIQQLGEKT